MSEGRMKNTNKKLFAGLLFGISCAMTLMPSQAFAWWNGDWSDREKITLDASATGANINEPIGSTSVLVRLHSGNFKFDKAKPDGSDIRFVAGDDQTPLKFHVEKFDNLLGEAFVWVSVPDLKPGTQTGFYLYYGNAKANPADDAKGSYDPDTVLAYHFGEHGAPAHDFTQWANNAQNAGTPADGALISTGLRLDGQHPVQLPVSQSLTWSEGQALTWSAWVRNGAAQPAAVVFSRRDGANAFVVGIDNGAPFVEVTNAAGTQRSTPAAALPPNGWHHLAVTASGAQIKLYVDGVQAATLAAAIPVLRSAAVIGGDTGQTTAGFTGDIDEMQISKIARPAGFIRAAAIGQGADAGKFIGFGVAEEDASWLSGYLVVILGSVTLDGWIVIGLLTAMALISWVVMADKASYIGRVTKANTVFLKSFEKLASDLTQLDHSDTASIGGLATSEELAQMTASPLYRVYHIGAREIDRRTQMSGFNREGLSPQSIEAIRASLDAGVVRETQKLNRLMVLLTIAISGGPFLGLLGTVMGVMITFAAIAASGDVNVNSIAPGIAAALVATVAGLIVAIPALFGYNYLGSRVKDVTADMHVFVDEFLTKMAEYYRPRVTRVAAE
jgi:biopolymer transport protein ExbB